jgi:hypothetical protein
MRIDVIVTWVSLAVIGAILYTAPKYILDTAKEGFKALTGKQIREMRQILDTPYYEDIDYLNQKGVKDLPSENHAGSTDSIPATADTQNCSSVADGQGSILNEKKEQRLKPEPVVVYKTQIQYVPAPAKECPDLRDFIKKDQIPCWNCSLPS